jgi:DNA-binding response OmpR family regulator
MARRPNYDVILLDVMLRFMDGFAVLKTLRSERCHTATIILTARDAMSDIVHGLDLGADDYLTKPFALDVLFARIRAVARRNPAVEPTILSFEDLTLNTATHELQRGNRTVSLTRTEFALLETLMPRPRCIVTRDQLIEAGWGLNSDVNDSTLYVFIRALRSKIAQGDEQQLLHTAKGVGYSLRSTPVE